MNSQHGYDPTDDHRLSMIVGVSVATVLGLIFFAVAYFAPPADEGPSIQQRRDQEKLAQIVESLKVPHVLVKCRYFSKKGRVATCHIFTPSSDAVVDALLAGGWKSGEHRRSYVWGIDVGWERAFSKDQSKFIFGCHETAAENYCYVQLVEPHSYF
ncbi:MAG: hypothetical protein ABL985_01315 [Casimicrobium sp.]